MQSVFVVKHRSNGFCCKDNSKARAMDGIESLFSDAIEHTPLGVSKSTVQMESAEVPSCKSDGPGSVSEQEHCTKDSLWVASL